MEQTLIVKDGKWFLKSEYRTGNKAFCAFIRGTHPKFKFQRDFINSTRNGLQLTEVKDGDIIEESVSSHSGKTTDRKYYQVQDGKLVKKREDDILLSFV